MTFWDRVRDSVGWDRDDRDRDRWRDERGDYGRSMGPDDYYSRDRGYGSRWGSGDYRRERDMRDRGMSDYRDRDRGVNDYGYGRSDFGRGEYGRDTSRGYTGGNYGAGNRDWDRGSSDWRDRDRWTPGRMSQGSYDDYDRDRNFGQDSYGFSGRSNYGGGFDERDRWSDRGPRGIDREFERERERERDRDRWRDDDWDRNRNRW